MAWKLGKPLITVACNEDMTASDLVGRYLLDAKNPNSEFFLSIHISYPDAHDRREAAEQGVDPGGAIMIHGQPNIPTRSETYYRTQAWTNGCIAVSNSDMIDIWLMTGDNTPIEIRP